jgi:type II secretory pathway component PulF
MRHVEPDAEQQSTLQQELSVLLRNAQAIQDALQCVADQQQVEVESFGAGLVQQPGAN